MDNYRFYLLSILNAASILGRAIVGPIADRVGALNLMIPEASGTGLLQFSWISVNSTAGIFWCLRDFAWCDARGYRTPCQ